MATTRIDAVNGYDLTDSGSVGMTLYSAPAVAAWFPGTGYLSRAATPALDGVRYVDELAVATAWRRTFSFRPDNVTGGIQVIMSQDAFPARLLWIGIDIGNTGSPRLFFQIRDSGGGYTTIEWDDEEEDGFDLINGSEYTGIMAYDPVTGTVSVSLDGYTPIDVIVGDCSADSCPIYIGTDDSLGRLFQGAVWGVTAETDPDGLGLDTVSTWAMSEPITVSLSADLTTIDEDGGESILTAASSALSDLDVTVDLSFTGSATFNTDYSASTTSIIIAAGQTNGTASISSLDDGAYEGDETVIVAIDGVSSPGTENGVQLVTITITDDESPPVVFQPAWAVQSTQIAGVCCA